MASGGDALPVLLGLVSALSWGAGDFSGGLATRKANVFGVAAVSQVLGVLLLLALALLSAEPLPGGEALGWAAAAGTVGGIGILALYRALAVERMGIAAPVTALLAAGIPVLFGAITQGLPGATQIAGFGLALVGVWFLSRPEQVRGSYAGLWLALVAGVGFGGFLILIHQAGATSFFWPLVTSRSASLILVLLAIAVGRQPWRPGRGVLPVILLAGALDVGGNAFYLLAAQTGRLDVAAVLSSLYPAATVVLAWLVLKERVTRVQSIGVVAVLVSIALIAG